MEDCCAVCAEPLEWIGYGPCGHLEVCFKCIARLRFVLNDKHCCICKQDCPTVFITKALGDYTRVVTEWNSLLNHRNNSGQGSLYFDRVVEAYFDDEEPFKIIEAMCRLYCSICEGAVEGESVTDGMVKKGHIFRKLDALRRHQVNVHKVFMCRLCLEGRKVFICEQKLYSKPQMDQHFRNGDSEVDGNEEERGGFGGHPMCGFCRKPFYGDNELYQHMSHEHFTCHICQRARPGQYEYYRDYDDVEAHFRQEHSLCEHPDCLAQKFIVFPGEAELKRHNATAHGGNMSRSQRNAALQIPVSFHYRRPGQDSSDDNGSSFSSRRGGRGRGGHLHTSNTNTNANDEQLIAAVHASVESANLENAVRESLVISPNADESTMMNGEGDVQRLNVDDREGGISQVQAPGDVRIQPSRYLAAVGGARSSAPRDAAFPPLPGASRRDAAFPPLHGASPRDAAFPPLQGGSKSAERRAKPKNQGSPTMAALFSRNVSGGRARAGIRVLNVADYRLSSKKDEADQAYSREVVNTTVLLPVGIPAQTDLETSNIRDGLQVREMDVVGKPQSNPANLSIDEIRAANKALIERIRAGLEGNGPKFAFFKDVSSLFKKGEISSKDYYVHITRLGVSNLVPELARLCPDSRKGKELMDAHAARLTK